MSEFVHGGDTISYESLYDGKLLDYSSNINPLGPPPSFEESIKFAMTEVDSYPDIKYRRLKGNIANYLHTKAEHIAVGNGAMEIIDVALSLFEKVVLIYPAFVEYELRSEVHGLDIVKIPLLDDFTLDVDAIAEELGENTVLILGNPNNPTGNRIPLETLKTIHQMVVEKNSFLLLDEAFFEFCPEDYDTIEVFEDTGYSNLGIIRAATKFFALPGIRLGYGVFSTEMIEKIERIQSPWTVNTFADAAAEFMFDDIEYIEESKEYIERERNFLLSELEEIDGLSVFPTVVNYVLLKFDGSGEELFMEMAKRGIIIRRCSNYDGLDDHFVRLAIKSREDNLVMLEVLRESVEVLR